MTYDVKLMLILICHLYTFFGKMFVKGFGPFFNQVVSFLRSTFEGGNGNPLQYSCLENPMDGGAW